MGKLTLLLFKFVDDKLFVFELLRAESRLLIILLLGMLGRR